MPEPSMPAVGVTEPAAPVIHGGPAASLAQAAAVAEPSGEAMPLASQLEPEPAPSGAPLFNQLGSAAPERVPQAKPLTPEPEPMPKKAVVTEQIDDAPFVAPKPIEPEVEAEPLGRPDPIAEADAVNAGAAEPRRPSRGLSLFRRMAQVGRALEAEADDERDKRSEPAMRSEPRMSEEPETPPAPTPEPEPEPEAPSGQQESLGPPPPPQDDGDLLEIPSFLRRQAN
jgi:cell division protein FtsZ